MSGASGEPIIDRWRDGDGRCHCTHCKECGRLFRTEELSTHMRQPHLGSVENHRAHREAGCRMLTLLAAGIRPDGLDAWVETELRLRDVREWVER